MYSYVATEREVISAPTDEQLNDASSNIERAGELKHQLCHTEEINHCGIDKAKQTSESAIAGLTDHSRSTSDIVCGVSIISSEVCTYLFAPRNNSIGCTYMKRNEQSPESSSPNTEVFSTAQQELQQTKTAKQTTSADVP